jgi:hypothetical protein
MDKAEIQPLNNQMPAQDGESPQVQNSKDDSGHCQQGYNPLASPPDIKKAVQHGVARRVGHIDQKDTDMEYCEDCGLPSKNTQYPLGCSRLDLSELGPGFPLYFEYILCCGVLLSILFALVGIQGLIANSKGVVCSAYADDDDYMCHGGPVIEYSYGNRATSDTTFGVSNVLNLVFVIIGVFVAFYYRRIQGMTADEVNRGSITTSDYTIIIKGVPATETPEKIKAFFEEKGGHHTKPIVKKVVLAYEIGTYIELVRKRNKLMESKAKGRAPKTAEQDLKLIEAKIQVIEEEVAKNSAHKSTGIAFVTFESEKDTKSVIRKFKKSALEKGFHSLFSFLGIHHSTSYNGRIVDIDRAPEPLDVFWENLGFRWWELFKKRILTLICTCALIACSFGMIFGISKLQDSLKKPNSNGIGVTLLSALGSYLVVVINGLIGFIVRKLAGFEKHKTYTYYFISIAAKLSYAQFLNTALITLFVQLTREKTVIKLWTADSLVSKVFFLSLLNAIVPSMTYFFNPVYILRVLNRHQARRASPNSKMTQQEANLLFEGPPFDIAQRYANVQKTMLFTAFYATLVPIGILFSLVGLFLTYWTDKYMLLRRHCRPNALGKDLAEEMADFLELILVSFCAGNLIFEKIVRGEISPITVTALIISIVAYLLPQNWLSKCIRQNDETVYNSKKYDEVKFFFITEYDRVNPITQEEAMREWFEEMMRLHEIPEIKDADEDANNTKEEASKIKKTKTIIENPYGQHLPGQNTISNLSNYANTNMSFNKLQNNSNMNFGNQLVFKPQQQQQQGFNNQGGGMNQFMNRQNFNFQQPMKFMNQQINSFNNQMQQMWPGNRVMPQPQNNQPQTNIAQHLPNRIVPEVQNNSFTPANPTQITPSHITTHLPQTQQPSNQLQFSQANPNNTNSMINAQTHLPQGNMNQPQYSQRGMNQPQMMPGYNGQPNMMQQGMNQPQMMPGYMSQPNMMQMGMQPQTMPMNFQQQQNNQNNQNNSFGNTGNTQPMTFQPQPQQNNQFNLGNSIQNNMNKVGKEFDKMLKF